GVPVLGPRRRPTAAAGQQAATIARRRARLAAEDRRLVGMTAACIGRRLSMPVTRRRLMAIAGIAAGRRPVPVPRAMPVRIVGIIVGRIAAVVIGAETQADRRSVGIAIAGIGIGFLIAIGPAAAIGAAGKTGGQKQSQRRPKRAHHETPDRSRQKLTRRPYCPVT